MKHLKALSLFQLDLRTVRFTSLCCIFQNVLMILQRFDYSVSKSLIILYNLVAKCKSLLKKFVKIMSLKNYDKCSKISNTFLFLFPKKTLVIMAGIHKLLVRRANREDSDQTASSEAV